MALAMCGFGRRPSLLAFLLALAPAASAEEVLDTIDEGVQFYKDGDYSEAVSSLNYAVQLIQQKKGGTLSRLLPEPLPGWTAGETSADAAGTAMFGGGVTASRSYRKDGGEVSIQILADSPMLQGMMMMFNNPMFAGVDGGRLERIGRQKVIVKYDPATRQGDVSAAVANRYLVTVEGSGVSKEEIWAYAQAIDFPTLAELP